MTLPANIQLVLQEAIDSVETDIQERVSKGEGHKDLDRLRMELLEMKAGTRKVHSDGLSRIIVDSMDWGQPCLKKFNEATALLRAHYRIRV